MQPECGPAASAWLQEAQLEAQLEVCASRLEPRHEAMGRQSRSVLDLQRAEVQWAAQSASQQALERVVLRPVEAAEDRSTSQQARRAVAVTRMVAAPLPSFPEPRREAHRVAWSLKRDHPPTERQAACELDPAT